MKMNVLLALLPLLLSVVIAGGCGKKGGDATAATEVAAKVNAEVISVHQVIYALVRAPNVTPESTPRAKREILERLIDQRLAMQRAIEKKLDRSPAVVQTIEAAKSEILARAYLEQIAAAQPRPTAEEVKKYYADYPELFSKRRIFNIEELVVEPKKGLANMLRKQVAARHSLQDIAAWLKSRGIRFAANHGVREAERIPLALLPTLQAMNDGEIRIIENNGRLEVIRVVATMAAPVDEATAAPRIQQFLSTRRSREVIAKEMKQIKESATIVYMGEFAGKPEMAEVKRAPEPALKPEPTSAEPPLVPIIEKGVRG